VTNLDTTVQSDSAMLMNNRGWFKNIRSSVNTMVHIVREHMILWILRSIV